MRFASVLAVVCAYTVAFAKASEEVEDPDVVVLTKDTFDTFLNETSHAVVEFYAPWCGHCKQLKPHYAKAATVLKESGSKVKLAKVDATVEEELAKRFDVKGYPTLFWFVDGEKREYTGGRTEPEILKWIERKTSPAYTTGDKIPEVKDRPVVVMTASEISEDFTKVAEQMGDDVVFHFVASPKATVNEFTIQHKGEEVIKSEKDANVNTFVTANMLPKFGVLDGTTYSKYMSSGKGLVWILMPLESSDQLATKVEPLRAGFVELAAKMDNFKFVYIDTILFQKAIESMLGVSEFPAVVVHKKAGDKKKFVLNGDAALDVAKVAEFVENVVAGKVTAVLKSGTIAGDNDKPVREVVSSTLMTEIFRADKDVLFEVYAPWCGHCKKLAPELDKLASKIRKDGLEDIITIAKMDGTENDSPLDSISWEGFPTLFYIKAGSQFALPFHGGRDAKSIWKWIKTNHSKSSVIADRLAAIKAAKEVTEGAEEEAGRDEL